jgi:hypothetical protein
MPVTIDMLMVSFFREDQLQGLMVRGEPPHGDASSFPLETKRLGALVLLYSVAIHCAERFTLEIRTSSMIPSKLFALELDQSLAILVLELLIPE